jgi:hypothetical protein
MEPKVNDAVSKISDLYIISVWDDLGLMISSTIICDISGLQQYLKKNYSESCETHESFDLESLFIKDHRLFLSVYKVELDKDIEELEQLTDLQLYNIMLNLPCSKKSSIDTF